MRTFFSFFTDHFLNNCVSCLIGPSFLFQKAPSNHAKEPNYHKLPSLSWKEPMHNLNSIYSCPRIGHLHDSLHIIFFVIHSVIHYILCHILCHTLYSFSYTLSYIIFFFIQSVIMKILVVILDSKLTLEKQVRAIAASASRKVVSLRKTMSVFRVVTVVAKCFWAFVLPVLEYCSPVWMSAATSLPLLLDRVVSQVSRLSGGSVSCDLWHRRKVASMCIYSRLTVWLITLCVVFFLHSM